MPPPGGSEAAGRAGPGATATAADPAARGRERRLLAAVCLATTLVPLSSTMVAVALPDVRADFGLSVSAAVWLVSAYLIVTAAAQPVAGGLGDRLGRRRPVLVGIVAFGVASLAAAAAPTYPVAVAARCAQAMCGALALVNAAATVRTALPAERRGRSFGLIGAAATLAAASGPPIGSVAVALAGWRGTFLAVLPLVLLALVACARWLPAEPPRPAAPGPRRFDLAGALLLLATLTGAAVFVNRLAEGLPLAAGMALAAATLAAAFAFGAVERAHPAPVLDLAVLRVRAVAFAGVAIGASNLAMYLVLLAVPLLIEGHDTVSAGALMAPMLFGAALVAPVGGRLSDRLGRRTPALVGNVLLALAMTAMVAVDLHSHVAVTAGLLGLAGVGLGLSTAAVQTAGAEALPAAQAGVAAGVSSASRYLGSILGTSLLALLISSGTGRPVFAVAAAAAGVSAVAAAGLGRRDAGEPRTVSG
jgi:DHA2 family methylenomycin A resistance protein-like MFS transporter